MADKAAPKSFAKRDRLHEIQSWAQKRWEDAKAFELDAPAEGTAERQQPKHMVTFPYPYMNGLLHLGHSFSLSKNEFSTGYERLQGKRALWPFGFHCTGMPIQAAANKLKNEMAKFGCPPVFPEPDATADEAPKEAKTDVTKHTSKKSKANAKKGSVWQWNIMKDMGLSDEEIPAFQDPLHWLQYFPPLAKEHLQQMGVRVDWRRSFITTPVNPYYDSFVRWQFNTLKKLGKVKFGKRYSIYSPLDGQLCADHDRASGEGVLPQEYTLIKMKLNRLPESLVAAGVSEPVYLVAATLRPETMYGQTNCWVLPDGEYGVFRYAKDGELLLCSDRAARNMSFQEMTKEFGKVDKVAVVKGTELIGLPVAAPLSKHPEVYCLPMLTVSLTKGTGVVTSVPSDSPDDYAAYVDLQKKPALREKYGVTEEMVSLPTIPIISVPGLGDEAAVTLYNQMKIKSQNDREKLALAKEQAYTKGFYEGVMSIGDHAGMKVQEAKPLVKEQLLNSGDALAYAEPEKAVESRSGDDCVVALTDQWYIDYGEEAWKQVTAKCLKGMNLYADDTRRRFEHTLGWLREWGCSRSFGLGTPLPWDPQYLIESLSDSTIYMAFYTVAHLLQGGVFDGSGPSPAGISADQMTDEVWDHILRDEPQPANTPISAETLAKLRSEFSYWYPVDMRTSGKDLINNHLTFFLFNHTAIFKEEQWPRGVRTNGHLMLNSAKMSKSTGNFLTLKDAIEKYTSDGMRFALAMSGDSNEDANFEEEVANAMILRLHNEVINAEALASANVEQDYASGPITRPLDNMFLNQIYKYSAEAKAAFEAANYRDAMVAGFYSLQNARDSYKVLLGEHKPHVDVMRKFQDVQAILLSPVCPHTCEYVWAQLHDGESIASAGRWPELPEANLTLVDQMTRIESMIKSYRSKIATLAKPKGKKAGIKAQHLVLVVSREFKDWQLLSMKLLNDLWQANNGSIPNTWRKEVMGNPDIKKIAKEAMPFVQARIELASTTGPAAFSGELLFDEEALYTEFAPVICKELGLQSARAVSTTEAASIDGIAAARIEDAIPGEPFAHFTE